MPLIINPHWFDYRWNYYFCDFAKRRRIKRVLNIGTKYFLTHVQKLTKWKWQLLFTIITLRNMITPFITRDVFDKWMNVHSVRWRDLVQIWLEHFTCIEMCNSCDSKLWLINSTSALLLSLWIKFGIFVYTKLWSHFLWLFTRLVFDIYEDIWAKDDIWKWYVIVLFLLLDRVLSELSHFLISILSQADRLFFLTISCTQKQVYPDDLPAEFLEKMQFGRQRLLSGESLWLETALQ